MKEFVHTKLEEQKNKQVDHVIVKQIVLTQSTVVFLFGTIPGPGAVCNKIRFILLLISKMTEDSIDWMGIPISLSIQYSALLLFHTFDNQGYVVFTELWTIRPTIHPSTLSTIECLSTIIMCEYIFGRREQHMCFNGHWPPRYEHTKLAESQPNQTRITRTKSNSANVNHTQPK